MRGSPPRVRGKLVTELEAFPSIGITPACAGKTAANYTYRGGIWDHPRVCGENNAAGDALYATEGSPPRVRGKHY